MFSINDGCEGFIERLDEMAAEKTGVRETLIQDMQKAIDEVKQWPQRKAQIFHHNDSDGLSSGAILSRTFERAGFEVDRFCLEKPYPALLRKVYAQEGGLIVFADFAGRIAPMLSELNNGRNLTLILDHHVAEAATDPRVHNLDPDLYGLKGDRDISGSTTCYLFAHTWDASNRDMAHIAAIGSVGDRFFVDGCLVSENRDAAVAAVEQGRMEIRPQAVGERYYLQTDKSEIPCDEFGAYLDTLGAAGFHRMGPDMGVRVCLEGPSPESDKMVEEFALVQARAFEKEIERIQKGAIRNTTHIQWFHVGNRFFPMGVKMIGVFCDAIRNADFIDPQRYIGGFQLIPGEIPGFGSIAMKDVKISMRVSDLMIEEIRAERKLGLDILLPEATAKLGGFSDACHTLTAATTVAIGKEEQLIGEMEKILEVTS